jgi:hypothetical protein
MAGDEGTEDTSHLEAASESIPSGIADLLTGVRHAILAASKWTKKQHIVVQSIITGGIFLIFIQLLNQIWQLFFASIWGQAVYATGIKLRLLPVPLSLAIYSLVLAIAYLYLYIRGLRTRIGLLESRLSEVEDEYRPSTGKSDNNE